MRALSDQTILQKYCSVNPSHPIDVSVTDLRNDCMVIRCNKDSNLIDTGRVRAYQNVYDCSEELNRHALEVILAGIFRDDWSIKYASSGGQK